MRRHLGCIIFELCLAPLGGGGGRLHDSHAARSEESPSLFCPTPTDLCLTSRKKREMSNPTSIYTGSHRQSINTTYHVVDRITSLHNNDTKTNGDNDASPTTVPRVKNSHHHEMDQLQGPHVSDHPLLLHQRRAVNGATLPSPLPL
ncbi:hypothetical protein B0H66DRAFT_134899 [Apodospora peruviana]|uniref:Secreted protein n=1 Tax=Apodospora peruviana TaxID=516989 RepID=A0AAE0MB54_9PEZI|nr:hypothetical protein B0H66DRAFT_134899 [Apodospora peruviana]